MHRGGFSYDFEAPAYQKNTTASYLTLARTYEVMTAESSYNAQGRGYPDLSALASFGIPVCDYGGCSGSGGTSASAPTIAGMFTQINDARLNAGLQPLGFINTRLSVSLSNSLSLSNAELEEDTMALCYEMQLDTDRSLSY